MTPVAVLVGFVLVGTLFYVFDELLEGTEGAHEETKVPADPDAIRTTGPLVRLLPGRPHIPALVWVTTAVGAVVLVALLASVLSEDPATTLGARLRGTALGVLVFAVMALVGMVAVRAIRRFTSVIDRIAHFRIGKVGGRAVSVLGLITAVVLRSVVALVVLFGLGSALLWLASQSLFWVLVAAIVVGGLVLAKLLARMNRGHSDPDQGS